MLYSYKSDINKPNFMLVAKSAQYQITPKHISNKRMNSWMQGFPDKFK